MKVAFNEPQTVNNVKVYKRSSWPDRYGGLCVFLKVSTLLFKAINITPVECDPDQSEVYQISAWSSFYWLDELEFIGLFIRQCNWYWRNILHLWWSTCRPNRGNWADELILLQHWTNHIGEIKLCNKLINCMFQASDEMLVGFSKSMHWWISSPKNTFKFRKSLNFLTFCVDVFIDSFLPSFPIMS